MDYLTMHGPALDGSGKTVETEVHPDNLAAFEAAGYVEGALPKKAKAEAEPEAEVKPKAKAKPKTARSAKKGKKK